MRLLICLLAAHAHAFAKTRALATKPQRRGNSSPNARGAVRMAAVPAADIVVMMNGLPGKMGYSVAEACIARGMTLADVARAPASAATALAPKNS